jgi:hypothetical protein
MTYITCSYDSELFNTVWTRGVDENQSILLMSDDSDFLRRAFDLIAQYAKKIDPTAALTACNIKKVEDLSLQFVFYDRNNPYDGYMHEQPPTYGLKRKYQYCVDIYEILPRIMRVFYGSRIVCPPSNCHGAAVVAAGILPIMMDLRPPTYWCHKVDYISPANIEVGDLVYLREGDHSFVYLSPELCLSKNGRSPAPLELYQTADVLKSYGYPAEALTSSEYVSVYRRKGSLDYLESVMPSLIEFWGFYYDMMRKYGVPEQHPKYARLEVIEKKLYELVISSTENPYQPQFEKDIIAEVYNIFRGQMPCGTISRSEITAKEVIALHNSEKRRKAITKLAPYVLGIGGALAVISVALAQKNYRLS